MVFEKGTTMTTTLVEDKVKELGTATFAMGINVQMWAGVYVEPIMGQPDTYEDENKHFTFDEGDYEDIRTTLVEKATELQRDVFTCMGYEAADMTHIQVALSMHRHGTEGIHDSKYTASEDLMFLYTSLSEIYNCLFELECVFEA